MSRLVDELAPQIAPVLLENLTAHYPYHDAHLFAAGDPPHDPFAAHPAFGNAFDWHSSVHSHWTAVQLCERGFAELEPVLVRNLSPANIVAETAYLRQHVSYERPYGWGWALLLAGAIDGSNVSALRLCARELRVMAATIAGAALAWRELLPLPVRHGVHSNTAFAMGLMYDACAALDLSVLERAIDQRARQWFASDRNWPAEWERSGNDFLSPGLAQADLLRRVMAREEFLAWWQAFVPNLSPESPLVSIASVPNVADGQIVHLHGLNLSRAAALANLAVVTQDGSLLDCAQRLYDASAPRAIGGHYSERHWLPTFTWCAATAIDASGILHKSRLERA